MGDSSPNRINSRRLAWQMVSICGILLIAYLFSTQSQPQRLLSDPPEDNLPGMIIVDGRLYWAVNDLNGPVILSKPVTGGPHRQIAREGPQQEIVLMSPPAPLSVVNRELFYTLYPVSNHTGGVGGGYSLGELIPFLGVYKSARQFCAQEKAALKRRLNIGIASEARVRCVPLQGGVPKNALPATVGHVEVGGDALYWIKPGRDEQTQFTLNYRNENKKWVEVWWNEVSGHSELWMKSLRSGSAQLLRSGISASTPLAAEATGLFWTEPHPFPDSRVDLYYYRSADSRLYRITNYAGDLDQSPPVEYEGHLYWQAYDPPTSQQHIVPTIWMATRIVRANLDGSQQQTALSLTDAKQCCLSALMAHRGALYCVLLDGMPGSSLRDNPQLTNIQPALCRLYPDRSNRVEVVSQLPARTRDFKIDEHYLYFLLDEPRRSLFDTLTDDQTHIQHVETLCRIGLPE